MNDDELRPVPTEDNPSKPQAESQIESQIESKAKLQEEVQGGEQDLRSTSDDTASTELQDSQPIVNGDIITNNTATAGVTSAKPKKSHKGLMIAAMIVLVVLGIGGTVYALVVNQGNVNDDSGDQSGEQSVGDTIHNQITNFDLAFLKNEEVNQLYSPLSIKYALGMLKVGAAGDSQQQIESVIGSLTPQKYPNNQNMSFANALFINNKIPDGTIKSSYTQAINEQLNAEILRVPFTSAVSINNWVSDKTFGLIKNLLTDEMLKSVGGPEQYFALVNALAIDMEWINKIQPYDEVYDLSFPHVNYSSSIFPLQSVGFDILHFNNSTIEVNSLKLAATIHRYDILNELGVDNIRQTVMDEYTYWLSNSDCAEGWPAPEVYIEEYLEELGDGGYKTVSSSTDFSFYDDEVKVFAKDLRTYDDVTLQYVGIMPKTTSLNDYVQNLTTDKLASTINQLKSIALENFKDGVVTSIVAKIPVFKFQDKLDLVSTLQSIGITDVFSETKADLSNLANDSTGLYIGQAIHQTTVDFNNDGIKASAATALVGGLGSSGCGFSYRFDVPVETIDLTFDNPYLFLIRDKESGTIWFVGTVYEPTTYTTTNH